jgi:hypothetical protein
MTWRSVSGLIDRATIMRADVANRLDHAVSRLHADLRPRGRKKGIEMAPVRDAAPDRNRCFAFDRCAVRAALPTIFLRRNSTGGAVARVREIAQAKRYRIGVCRRRRLRP